MTWFRPTSLFDKIFEGGIIIKGFTGLMEFIAGGLLFFISPDSIQNLIFALTQKEHIEDPNDMFVNLLLNATHDLSANGRTFLIIYLWIHAIIKLIAVIGILKNQLWAYPFSLITLGVLMIYQVYSITIHATIGMIGLTIFDVFILWLIWREYGTFKQNPSRIE